MEDFRELVALQERRVATYRVFDEALKAFVETGDEQTYKARAIEVTAAF
jgi:hypothetical protein